MRADIDERAETIAWLDTALTAAVDDEATAREVHDAAEQAAEQARATVEAQQAAVDTARVVAHRLSDRDEADRLATRLAKLEAALRDSASVDGELSGIRLTDATMRAVETAALAVERAAGQAELASARIELEAVAGVDLCIGDEPVQLTAGQSWSANATAPTVITVPGLLTARIVPGTPAAQTQAKLDAAHTELTAALQAVGADSLDAARALHERRRDLTGRRTELAATVRALTGDDTIDALRDRLALLRDGQPAEAALFDLDGPADAAAARAELDAAVAAHQRAVADCETHRKVAVAASKRLAEKSTRLTAVREKATAARAELEVATARLAAARAVVTDEALAVAAEAEREAAERAAAQVAALRDELARSAPEAVDAAFDEAQRCARTVATRQQDAAGQLRELAAALRVYGTEGRHGRLDAASTEREHAESDYVRVQRRARAADTLRSVMSRHRAATRQRYVDPFRREVERLGRLVFGESFEVEIDPELRITHRTVAGRTVPYESLSGGAKEQLGIVARMAGAALVATEDSVPVVIDDALGFTDPDRLLKMGGVFDVVGEDGQVIVLTCDPQRYAAVAGAHHIELTS